MGKFKKYFEQNEKANQYNVCDTAKVVLRETFISWNACVTKEEKSQIRNLSSHLKNLKIEE